MKKFRIVQIVTRSDNIGGSQIHVRDLSLELQKQGHEVWVIVGGNGPFIEELKLSGIKYISLKYLIREVSPYYDFLCFLEIRRVLKEIQPHLVATHTSKAGLIGRFAAWSLGVPVTFTVHGWSYIQEAPKFKQKVYLQFEKIAGYVTSAMITVSEYDRQYCLKHRLIDPSLVFTIHNGIPDIDNSIKSYTDNSLKNSIDKFISTDDPIRLVDDHQEKKVRLIMIARLERPKNHQDLLAALVPLIRSDWSLTLVGDGPLRSQIEDLVKQYGLAKKVSLLGARQDIKDILRDSHCFVLISDMEGLPLSILEAMRASLPIIASDVGGVSEIVKDGDNGFLIPKGDVEELTEFLKILINDRALRVEMGTTGRKRYEKFFKIQAMVDETLTLYKRIASNLVRNIEEIGGKCEL